MPGLVYILCSITSLACGVLLFRGYRQSGVRLLFWSSLCFFGLGLENGMLYFDRHMVPDIPLSIIPRLPGLIAMMLLLFGLIWEVD